MSDMLLALLLLLSIQAAAQPADPSLRVMSYNIRLNIASDGVHAWPNRRDAVARLIRFHEPDLIGVQEALRGQLDDLSERLPGYAWLGVGRDDGADAGEFSAIFYRTDRFEVLEEGTFWLSETPDVPGSTSWDAAITRVATYARFRDRATGETFHLFNTHFDHVGVQARLESARLLTRRIRALGDTEPVIVTGDFNVTPDAAPYAVLTETLRDAYHTSELPHHGPAGTFSGFEAGPLADARRIDYILTRGPVRTLRHATLADQHALGFPSDHLPVFAEVVVGD